MPKYDYRCLNCRKRFDIFMTYSEYGTKPVLCPHCGSADVTRKIGRVRVARSNQSRLDNMAEMGSMEGLENNPQEMGRMMRKMQSEVGEDMGPMFNEVVGRLEAGENLEDIDSAMPDIDAAGGDDSF